MLESYVEHGIGQIYGSYRKLLNRPKNATRLIESQQEQHCLWAVLYLCTHAYMYMYWWSFYTIHSSGELIEVKNIYGVHRPVEDGNFTHQLDNKQLLFHSSPVSNCLNLFLISSHIHCRSKISLEFYQGICCIVYNARLFVCLSVCLYVCMHCTQVCTVRMLTMCIVWIHNYEDVP